MEKNDLALPIAVVLAGIIVAGAVFYTNKDNIKKPSVQKKPTQEINIAMPGGNDSITGNPQADVIVIEYSDTECPFCKVFHNTMLRIMDTYGKDGKVAWIFRHMPLDSLHKKARKESIAIECAKQQGGNEIFWKYLDEVMKRTNSNDSLPESELTKIATDLKLDVAKWNSCYSTDATAYIVKEQEKTGADAGVEGTPNNFLVFKKPLSDKAIENLITAFAKYPEGTIRISDDGKIVNLGGAMPYNLMTFVIDNALNDK